MNNRLARRPVQPNPDTEPGICKFCGEEVRDEFGRRTRGRAHPWCRKDWRIGNDPAVVREFVLWRDNYTCFDCRHRFPESQLEADHNVELADGGTNDPSNYVARCMTDHAAKTEERRMARAGSKPNTKKQNDSKKQPTQATRQKRPAGEPPPLGPVVGLILCAWLALGGLALASTVFVGDRYTDQAVRVAGGIGVALLALWVARMAWWKRSTEAQRVFERLCNVTKDPYAARRRIFKVRAWSWFTPVDVTLRPGRAFRADDAASMRALEDEYARALFGAPSARVTARVEKRGRVRITVAARGKEGARVEQVEPAHAEPVLPATPAQEDTLARLTASLAPVLGLDGPEVDLQAVAWHPDGFPSALRLTYPPHVARLAPNARLDLVRVLTDVSPPRTDHGRWDLTHKPADYQFGFLDRADSLARTITPAPVEARIDLVRGPLLGLRADGQPWHLPLLGTHQLVAGATGAGKGSIVWGIIRAVQPMMQAGLVRLYVLDPKQGMELGQTAEIAYGYADTAKDCADLLGEVEKEMQEQARRLKAGRIRNLADVGPSVANPLHLVIVDEIANLTGQAPREIANVFGEVGARLLTMGRAAGVCMIGCVQVPKVENLKLRDMFPSTIGLRLQKPNMVKMVLGDGARESGAACDLIPKSLPGTGYVVTDEDPEPMRVRAAFITNAEVDRICAVETAPEHGAPVGRGEQLALAPGKPRVTYSQEPVPVAEPAREVVKTLANANTPAAKVGKAVQMRELVGKEHGLLPDDPDAVTVVAAGPDPEDEDQDYPTSIEVTYVYDGETTEKVATFDSDAAFRLV